MLDAMDADIDAVVIGTPDHTHAVIALEAMKRKKHVYCEKPLCHSVREVRALMEAAKESRVVTPFIAIQSMSRSQSSHCHQGMV